MVNLSQVEEQLERLGCNFRFWGRPEIRELCNVLVPGETIAACTNGQYDGGFAMLCATNHRLLLIDKRPFFLTLEDVRFDMIAEIDYNARLLSATAFIITPTRCLTFSSWRQDRLRSIVDYAQQRVTELRQHYTVQQIAVPLQGALSPDIPLATEPFEVSTITPAELLAQDHDPVQGHHAVNPYTHGPLVISHHQGARHFYMQHVQPEQPPTY